MFDRNALFAVGQYFTVSVFGVQGHAKTFTCFFAFQLSRQAWNDAFAAMQIGNGRIAEIGFKFFTVAVGEGVVELNNVFVGDFHGETFDLMFIVCRLILLAYGSNV